MDSLLKISCDIQDHRSCWEAVEELWPLAPWIMKAEYMESACLCPASNNYPQRKKKIEQFLSHSSDILIRGKGCCHILFAVTDSHLLSQISYCKEAFLLPLLWKKNYQDGILPDGLKTLSRTIQEILQIHDWELSWNFDDKNSFPLDLNLEFDSGWASLTTSLLLAVEGGISDTTIMATVSWNAERGIQPVSCLEKKIEAAYDSGCRILFVSHQDKEKAEGISQRIAEKKRINSLSIKTLEQGKNDTRQVLKPYLAYLDWPPDKTQDLETRCNYYNRQSERDKNSAYDYYVKNLVEDLVEKCRQQGIQGISSETLEQLENLISFVSLNTGALLGFSIIKAKRALLFYTKQSQKDLPLFEKMLTSRGCQVEKKFLDKEDNVQDEDWAIFSSVQSFVQKYGAEKTAIDVSPGPKNFSLMAIWAVNPEVTPCFYVAHSYSNKSVLPGKEKIRRLQPYSAKKEIQ